MLSSKVPHTNLKHQIEKKLVSNKLCAQSTAFDKKINYTFGWYELLKKCQNSQLMILNDVHTRNLDQLHLFDIFP